MADTLLKDFAASYQVKPCASLPKQPSEAIVTKREWLLLIAPERSERTVIVKSTYIELAGREGAILELAPLRPPVSPSMNSIRF